jgi:integrase
MAIIWSELRKTKAPGIRRRPDDGRLVIRVRQRDPRTGKRKDLCKVLQTQDLEEAIIARAHLSIKLKHGPLEVRESPMSMTLTDYARRWLKRRKLEGDREHTISRYIIALENFILPTLGHFQMDAMSTHHVLAWRDWLLKQRKSNGEKYSGWTLAGYFAVLRTVIKEATIELELPLNPMANVKGIPKARSPRAQRYLNRSLLAEFLEYLYQHSYQHFVITTLMAAYGLRFEEVSGLHIQHVDEEAMELMIIQANIRGIIYPTKTETGRRLPLAESVLELIREHERFLEAKNNPGYVQKGILFPSRTGGYRFTSSVERAYNRASEAIGVGWKVRPHDLRRTAVNLMRQANVGDIVQRSLVGHSSSEMTEHYSSVSIGEKREAHDKVLSMLHIKLAGKKSSK